VDCLIAKPPLTQVALEVVLALMLDRAFGRTMAVRQNPLAVPYVAQMGLDVMSKATFPRDWLVVMSNLRSTTAADQRRTGKSDEQLEPQSRGRMMSSDSPVRPLDEKRALLAEILKKQSLQPFQARLSQGEERLWRLLQLDSDSAVYNVGFAYELEGALDVDTLVKALRSLTQRHEALRTGYGVIDGVPKRLISPELAVRFERVDLKSISKADFPGESRRIAIEVARTSIDLTKPPLWRFTLLERSDCDKVFLVNTHHIISDRWSVGLLMQELAAEYSAIVRGEPSPLSKPATSNSEAIGQLDALLSESEVAENLAYWRGRFRGEVRDLILPTGRPPAGEKRYSGLRRTFTVPDELAVRIGTLAAGENVTVYVVTLAALAVCLYADSGQTDLVFVTPVSRRHHAVTRGVVGYFNNLVPIRVTIADGFCFRDLLRSTAQVVKGAFEHQDVPFQRIAEQPGLNHIRLGRCVISVQNTTSLELDLPGITSSYYDVPTDTANFDLAVSMEEHQGTFRGWVDAKTDLWTQCGADDFIASFLAILKNLADQPEKPLDEFFDEARASASRALRETKRPVTQAPVNASTTAGSPIGLENELERQIIGIWEDVIGVRPLGPESNFFALSGDSLLAARLFDRIGRVIGRELPLAALLEAPSIRQLSSLLMDRGDVPWWAVLVPLQPNGTRPPLFCVHGGGGGVLTYTRVAEHLGPDQPLWGLQAPKHEDSMIHLGVEEIARQYIQAIYSVSPDGPYNLCGHSFGGLVAFEMARQLKDQGKRVSLLVIIDHPGPDARVTWVDKLRWYAYSLGQLDRRQRGTYLLDRVKWIVRKNPRMPGFLRRWASNRVGQSRGSKSTAEYRIKTLSETMTALELYRPGKYEGRLTVFRARGGSPAINTDRFGGWGLAAQGRVEVHDFHCDHMQLFEEPNCRNVSAELRDCLDRAQRHCEEVDAVSSRIQAPSSVPA
jgi:thioesterase domain-containing protein